MICPKCGSYAVDGSVFCRYCGANLTEAAQPAQYPVYQNGNEAPVYGAQEVQQNQYPGYQAGYEAPYYGAPVYQQPAAYPPVAEPPKKKKLLPKLLLIGLAAAAIVAVVLLVTGVFSSRGDDVFVCLSDGKFELFTELDREDVIELGSAKSTSYDSRQLSFSSDGKYVYYLTKFNGSDYTGTLCRAELGKLRTGSNKNDQAVEIIASSVRIGFKILDDGTVLYQNQDNTLYYFDGQTTNQLAKETMRFQVDEKRRVLIVTGSSYDGMTLYGIELEDLNGKVKLASNVYNTVMETDFENILYLKREDDGTRTLYSVGFHKDAEKLAEKISIAARVNDAFYYTVESGNTLSPYDYVTDEKAESDRALKEPELEDYAITTYDYFKITGDDLEESDYKGVTLYTSCTKELYWFGLSSWRSYTMEDALTRDYGDRTEEIHAAIQEFITKYGDSANEDGYILVTPEVKQALININEHARTYRDWGWLWFCCTYDESGTSYDYDRYHADSSVFDEARTRVWIRDRLQDPENAYPLYNICKYSDGKQTVVQENVLNTQNYNGVIFFNTVDMITDKLDLELMDSPSDVADLFKLDLEKENQLLLCKTGEIVKMSRKAAETFTEICGSDYPHLYILDKELLLSVQYKDLAAASIKNGVVEDFKLVSDDAAVVSAGDEALYFVSGSYLSSDVYYCDLWEYRDGKSSRLLQDVVRYSATVYGDDSIYAYTGYRNRKGYELTKFDPNGEKTIISDEVTAFVRVDKNLCLYISDKDLYAYDGKEKKLIRLDVEQFWSLNRMKVKDTLYLSN